MYNQIDANKRKTVMLVALFGVFIGGLSYVMNAGYGFVYEVVIGAVILSSIMSLSSYYAGDKFALWSTGAKVLARDQNPYVYRIIENLTMASGMPMPKVYLIDSPALNAFATGRNPEHASIALTTG